MSRYSDFIETLKSVGGVDDSGEPVCHGMPGTARHSIVFSRDLDGEHGRYIVKGLVDVYKYVRSHESAQVDDFFQMNGLVRITERGTGDSAYIVVEHGSEHLEDLKQMLAEFSREDDIDYHFNLARDNPESCFSALENPPRTDR